MTPKPNLTSMTLLIIIDTITLRTSDTVSSGGVTNMVTGPIAPTGNELMQCRTIRASCWLASTADDKTEADKAGSYTGISSIDSV